MSASAIVVPCYNEAGRLDLGAFEAALRNEDVRLLFVDDGSGDATREIVEGFAATDERIGAMSLPTNRGKAEAVRQGLQRALGDGADIVCYLDADLSTPIDEILRLIGILRERDDLDAVLGARVSLMGRAIGRSRLRHYLGRVFATVSGLVLGVAVYDTQCGAKVLRAGAPLDTALASPFHSRWSFDVELIGRLLRGNRSCPAVDQARFYEEPLYRWHDVAGSKLTVWSSMRSLAELVVIWRELRAYGR